MDITLRLATEHSSTPRTEGRVLYIRTGLHFSEAFDHVRLVFTHDLDANPPPAHVLKQVVASSFTQGQLIRLTHPDGCKSYKRNDEQTIKRCQP